MSLPSSFVEAVQRGSDEPLFTTSLTGRVIWWGHVAQSLLGHARTEAVGRSLLALAIAAESADDISAAITRAGSEGIAICEVRFKARSGRPVDPMLVRIQRRREGSSEDLVFVVGQMARPTPPTSLPVPSAPTPSSMRPVEAIPELTTTRAPSLHREAHEALGTSHEASVMLRRLARLLVPAFADACRAYLTDARGDPILVENVPDARSLTPLDDAALVTAVVRAPTSAPPMPEGLLVVPIAGRLRTVGAITVQRERPSFLPEEREWLADVARRAALEIENIRLTDMTQRAHDEARRASQRAEQLMSLARALSGALTAGQVANVVLTESKRILGADGGAIAVLSSDRQTVEVVATAGSSDALFNAKRQFPVSSRVPLADAARSGHPVFLESLRASLPLYDYLAHTSGVEMEGALAAIPLTFEERATGALGLYFSQKRIFSHEDRANLTAIARHCSDAMERVRLYESERRARAEAGEEARRLEIVSEASRMLATRLDDPETLRVLTRTLVPAIADWTILYEQKGGRLRPVAWYHRDATKNADLAALALGDDPDPASPLGLGRVFGTGRPQLLFNVPDHLLVGLAADERHLQLLRSVGITSQMMLPLVARDRTLGVLVVTYTGFRRYNAGDVVLIEELARRAALALDNARLYRESQENEERYRLLVEGVHDHAIFFLDPQGRVATWNTGAQRLFGHASNEVIGQPHSFAYADEARIEKPAMDLQAAIREGRFEEDAWRERKDGTKFWANVLITRLVDEGTRGPRGFAVIVRDLTERRRTREVLDQARAQLAATEKLSALGSLVSGVAHEIRTPLTVMANNLHIMEMRLRGAIASKPEEPIFPSLHDRVSAAIGGIDRLNNLVEDLRKFTRVKPGTRMRLPLEAVIPDAIDLFQAANRGRIVVETRLHPTPACEVDVLQIQQILLNLLQNAADAMPHSGRVVVETRPDEKGAAIVVTDEGAGMPPDVYRRMFEEFFTTKPHGTGLGLSIVRRIVEGHKGSITCETAPGQGTKFTITLPQAA